MSRRPSIKTNHNTAKRGDMQTTMSANLGGKTRSRQRTKLSKTHTPNIVCNQNKPNISPFELIPSKNNQQKQQKQNGRQCFEIKAIKNINYQYISLFNQLFKNNPCMEGLTDVQNRNKLNRQERYQLQCMKIIVKISINIDRINYQRKLEQDWKKISDYLDIKSQLHYKNKQPNKICNQLISRYKNVQEQLQCVQNEHKQLTKKYQLQMWQISNKPDKNLNKKQKQYKQTQKKLNKILNDEQYYIHKFQRQQQVLKELQQKINKIQLNKLNLQMKIISEKAKKDRLTRKAKQKRQKSLTPNHTTNQQQKVIRSKSSIRFNGIKNTYIEQKIL